MADQNRDPASAALRIPEIRILILKDLSLKSLLNCLRVCKDWKASIDKDSPATQFPQNLWLKGCEDDGVIKHEMNPALPQPLKLLDRSEDGNCFAGTVMLRGHRQYPREPGGSELDHDEGEVKGLQKEVRSLEKKVKDLKGNGKELKRKAEECDVNVEKQKGEVKSRKKEADGLEETGESMVMDEAPGLPMGNAKLTEKRDVVMLSGGTVDVKQSGEKEWNNSPAIDDPTGKGS
ncbi:hypothetical protein LTR17_026417 [Elasticomyces elasticus]|nr:hypothetical protein LTR17_026417 [Elasticomyces elasticus]